MISAVSWWVSWAEFAEWVKASANEQPRIYAKGLDRGGRWLIDVYLDMLILSIILRALGLHKRFFIDVWTLRLSGAGCTRVICCTYGMFWFIRIRCGEGITLVSFSALDEKRLASLMWSIMALRNTFSAKESSEYAFCDRRPRNGKMIFGHCVKGVLLYWATKPVG